jgi:threonine dehydratase
VTLALPDAQTTIVEPEGWDDMCRSLAAGWIESVGDSPPPTACDALQTFQPAQLTFDVLSRRGVTGVTVSEAEVRAAQRWAARKLRLVVEPGGSVALAALLAGKVQPTPDMLVVLSGGNADAEAYARVLSSND